MKMENQSAERTSLNHAFQTERQTKRVCLPNFGRTTLCLRFTVFSFCNGAHYGMWPSGYRDFPLARCTCGPGLGMGALRWVDFTGMRRSAGRQAGSSCFQLCLVGLGLSSRVCTYAHTHVHTHARTHAQERTHTRWDTRTRAGTPARRQAGTRSRRNKHTRTHTHTRVCTHTHQHARTDVLCFVWNLTDPLMMKMFGACFCLHCLVISHRCRGPSL